MDRDFEIIHDVSDDTWNNDHIEDIQPGPFDPASIETDISSDVQVDPCPPEY